MTDLYTRCPHCQTVFRLHPTQLQLAEGKVRCGACMNVFLAKQHLVRPKAAPAKTETPAAEKSASSDAQPTPAPPVKNVETQAILDTPPTPAKPPSTTKSITESVTRNVDVKADTVTTESRTPPPTTPSSASPASSPGKPAAPEPIADPFAVFASSPLPKGIAEQATGKKSADQPAKSTAPSRAEPPMATPKQQDEPEDEPLWINDDPAVDLADDEVRYRRPTPQWSSPMSKPANVETDRDDEDDDASDEEAIVFTPSTHRAETKAPTEEPAFDESEFTYEASFDDEATATDHADETLDLDVEDNETDDMSADIPSRPAFDSTLEDEPEATGQSDEDDLLHDEQPESEPDERVNADDNVDAVVDVDSDEWTEPVEASESSTPITNPRDNDWHEWRSTARARHEPIFDDENGLDADTPIEDEEQIAYPEHTENGQPHEADRQDDDIVEQPAHDERWPESPFAENEPDAYEAAKKALNEELAQHDKPKVDFGETDEKWVAPSARIETIDVANPLPRGRPKTRAVHSTSPQKTDLPDNLELDSNWQLEPLGQGGFDNDLLSREERSFSWKPLLWFSLALLLGAALGAQYLWSKRVDLRDDETFGPLIESSCEYLDCALPPKRDISRIVIKQKSVIKERDDARRLKIDLLIVNQAGYDQPYPDLMLRFTNIEGKVVAEDRFAPNEYLREMPEQPMMPADIPVHVSFVVRSPSAAVTGYEFGFLEPIKSK